MSYFVQNITRNTVYISDIRVEIGPGKMLDLEKVVTKADIESSMNLKAAIKNFFLKVLNRSDSIRKPETTKRIEYIAQKNPSLTEQQIIDLLRGVLKEQQPKSIIQQPTPSKESLDEIKTLINVVASLHTKLDQIQNNTTSKDRNLNIDIDPEKLAQLQYKAVEKLSSEIESNNSADKGKKVILSNSDVLKHIDEL